MARRFAFIGVVLLALTVTGFTGADRQIVPGPARWTTNGPWGASVLAMAASPTTPGTLFASTIRGVFGTTSGGARWFGGSKTFPARGDIRAESVTVDSSTPARVFAGTVFSGLYRSRDGGESWIRLAPEIFEGDSEVNIVEVDPHDPNTVYAVQGKNILRRSIDGGETWTPIALPPGVLQALAIAPSDSNVLYAGNFYYGNELPNPVTYCVARSVDAGATWQGVPCSTFANQEVLAAAVDPVDPTVAYVSTSDRLYKTVDGGSTWTLSVRHSYIDQISSISITIAPLDRDVVAVSDHIGVQISTDRGGTWIHRTSESDAVVSCVLADPFDAATLYLGQSDGVFRSSDQGATWTRLDAGMDDFSVPDLSAVASDAKTLFAASPEGRGPYRTVNGGDGWSPNAQSIFSTKAVATDPSDPDFVYTVAFGISRSIDGGATWATVRESDGSFLTSVAVDPQDSSLVYVGEDTFPGPGGVPIGGGVLWSGDRGEHWNAPPEPARFAVLSLSVSPIGGTVLAASRQGVFRSDDHGESWSATALSNLSVTWVRHAAGGRVAYAATSSGAFRSDDGGASWSTASGGIEGKALSALAVDPADAETVFVSDGFFVFVTYDGGERWSALSVAGLGGAQVLTLLAVPGGGTLYAGTDHGAFAVRVRRTRAVTSR